MTKEGFDKFTEDIPTDIRADLLKRFFDHMPFISTTERGREFIRVIFGPDGFFKEGTILGSELGANFFLSLTDADPAAALTFLKNTVAVWDKQQLESFTIGRREVVWALQRIAIWRDLFSDAARVLLVLAETETESWSNNASGVFAELFTLAPAPIAPTEASPEDRFGVLKEALESDSRTRRALAIRACDQALEASHFSRMIGAEHQGLRKDPQLWKPKTYGEWFDGYRRVWLELRDRLKEVDHEESAQIIDILLRRARGLIRTRNLAGMVVDTLEQLATIHDIDRRKILKTIFEILRYEKKQLPLETIEPLNRLKETLTGQDFSSLMKRYVGMAVFEDSFEERSRNEDFRKSKIRELAEQSLREPELLATELSWLVTNDAPNGFQFGYQLGQLDIGESLLPSLMEAEQNAGENASAYFLGGYFRAIRERDIDRWEKLLDATAADPNLAKYVPELTWRSGMSDRAALRLLDLADKGTITVNHFGMFRLGSVIGGLSQSVFESWIRFLLASNSRDAVSIAMDLYVFYYLNNEPAVGMIEDLTLKLLTHELLFKKVEGFRGDTMDDYHWTEIGQKFVNLFPQRGNGNRRFDVRKLWKGGYDRC